MAIGKQSDVVIYEEQFVGGETELSEQMSNVFNGASRNSIRLIPRAHRGHYLQESFFKNNTVGVVRRDTTDLATDLTPTPLAMDDHVAVKLDRLWGPFANSVDSLKKQGKRMGEFSFTLGQQFAVDRQLDYLNSCLIAAVAAINNVAALKYDATGQSTKTMIPEHLINGISKFGDRGNRIIAWVMHSAPFYRLMESYVTKNIFDITGMVIAEGSNFTLGKPVIVTDSPALVNLNGSGTDTYNTLGLVADAIHVLESEEMTLAQEIKTGKPNIYHQLQAEHAFSIGIKGYKWDTTNGGENPNDTDLGTGGNWDKVASDNKSTAGIIIETE